MGLGEYRAQGGWQASTYGLNRGLSGFPFGLYFAPHAPQRAGHHHAQIAYTCYLDDILAGLERASAQFDPGRVVVDLLGVSVGWRDSGQKFLFQVRATGRVLEQRAVLRRQVTGIAHLFLHGDTQFMGFKHAAIDPLLLVGTPELQRLDAVSVIGRDGPTPPWHE